MEPFLFYFKSVLCRSAAKGKKQSRKERVSLFKCQFIMKAVPVSYDDSP